METSNPRSTKPGFLKDTKVISIKVHIGFFLEDRKSHFCHSAAKKMLRLRKSHHMSIDSDSPISDSDTSINDSDSYINDSESFINDSESYINDSDLYINYLDLCQ